MNCYYCKYSYPRATTQRFNTVFNPCQNYPSTPRPFILAPSSSFNSAPKSLSKGERGVNLSPTKRCALRFNGRRKCPPPPPPSRETVFGSFLWGFSRCSLKTFTCTTKEPRSQDVSGDSLLNHGINHPTSELENQLGLASPWLLPCQRAKGPCVRMPPSW